MSLQLLATSSLLQQGAEARIYKAQLHSPSQPPVILKHRFNKTYRHPSLDTSLTKSRVTMEARALLRCLRAGVCVPGIRMVDLVNGVLGVEFIDGPSVRSVLGGGADADEDIVGDNTDDWERWLSTSGAGKEHIMRLIGYELAKMHAVDVIHGDLTTSNMMLRHRSPPQNATSSKEVDTRVELVLIDFGLSYQSGLVEDKAVDLYVLERAFVSTHPESEPLYSAVLNAYAVGSGKAWDAVYRRLEDVRMRGRKRSMVG